MKVLKYTLDHKKTVQEITMPRNAKILSVQARGVCVCLWVLGHEDMPEEKRKFEAVETGMAIPSTLRTFIGTVHLTGFSIHVFELINQISS